MQLIRDDRGFGYERLDWPRSGNPSLCRTYMGAFRVSGSGLKSSSAPR